jgi:hypothetical protein
MSPTIYIGCSGFSFRDWKGVFYPSELPPRKWLTCYCSQFNSLELNVTFYRLRWYSLGAQKQDVYFLSLNHTCRKEQ